MKVSKKITRIQLLRGIAALLVVMEHAQTEAYQYSQDFERIPFSFGIGVDLFFIISGYIMLLSSQKLYGSDGALLIFLKRRIERILPLYWFFTLLMVLAMFAFPSQLNVAEFRLQDLFLSLLFIPYFAPDGDIQPLLALGWTLNCEMFFYAIFSVTLFFGMRLGVAVLTGAMVGFSILGLFITKEHGAALEFWTRPIILEFAFGVLAGYFYIKFGQFKSVLGFAFFILLAGFAYILLDGIQVSRALELGLPAALFFSAFTFFMPTKLEDWAEGLAHYVGDSSYSLYLSHPFTLAVVKVVWSYLAIGSEYLWGYVIVATLTSAIAAYVIYILIERPLVEYFHGRKRKRRQIMDAKSEL